MTPPVVVVPIFFIALQNHAANPVIVEAFWGSSTRAHCATLNDTGEDEIKRTEEVVAS